MPDVLLLPVKIRIEGIIIMNKVTPRLYFSVCLFFKLFRSLRRRININNVTDAVIVLKPANRIGGIIFVEWAIMIGKSEYIKVSPKIIISPVLSWSGCCIFK